ncbi:MAG: class I SAM-dependent methyltransferase [Anaerolineales bacterium]|nr:class I SAM-dependent methyltransferase [Anaerolineales bacterium]
MSDAEKNLVLKNNARHNQERPDYADPTLYQAGKSYDAVSPDPLDTKTKSFKEFLEENHPESVLEIGPGSGYLTKYIVEIESVKDYTAVDINKAFLDYLEPRLAKVKSKKHGFTYALLPGDINDLDLAGKTYDAIVFLSAVHHIPDRIKFFTVLGSLLNPGGKIYTQEPAHYIPRKLYLLRKFQHTYRRKEYWSNPDNYSTHHFCTLEEFEQIVAKLKDLQISNYYFYRINFPFPRLFKKLITKGLAISGKHPEPDGTFSTRSRKSIMRFFADNLNVQFKRIT